MSKKTKKLLFAVIILLIFCGVYLVVTKYTADKEAQEAKEETKNQVELINHDSDSITAFSYETTDNTKMSFTKKDDTWTYDEDKSISLTQDTITTMIEKFSDVNADRLIESSASDLTQYGLDADTTDITVTSNDKTDTIHVGAYNGTTASYYVMINDSKDVYLLSSDFVTTFTKTIEELKES